MSSLGAQENVKPDIFNKTKETILKYFLIFQMFLIRNIYARITNIYIFFNVELINIENLDLYNNFKKHVFVNLTLIVLLFSSHWSLLCFYMFLVISFSSPTVRTHLCKFYTAACTRFFDALKRHTNHYLVFFHIPLLFTMCLFRFIFVVSIVFACLSNNFYTGIPASRRK